MRLWQRTAAALLSSTSLAACGSPVAPTPTPLALPQLQSRYLQAANAYNAAEAPISAAENKNCVVGGGDLARCQTALRQDKQATVAFDEALKGIPFPAAVQPTVAKLLKDDASLERTLDQAAAPSSLGAAAGVFVQLAQLYATTAHDADDVRAALKLPKGSPAASASPSPG